MDHGRREILLAAARDFGPEKFNLLVNSVNQVRTLGRLRFWQEESIAQLAQSTGIAVSGLAQFIAIFDGADPIPVPPPVVPREDFLSCPNDWYYHDEVKIPDEWIAEAWEQVPEFRDNVTYEFVKEANKNGDLYCLQTSLQSLARILPLARMIELYEQVRDGSPNREAEFRPAFARVLGKRKSQLPAPLSREHVLGIMTSMGLDPATALELLQALPPDDEEVSSDDAGPF